MARARDEIRIAGVRLTSPDRVLFAGQGITKRDLALYYEAIAEWILPQLAGRPLTLLRCPAGEQTECFVQRRASENFPEAVRRVEVAQEDGTVTYVMVDSLPGLLSLVQLGVLELHTWSARRDRLDRPDRMILDLDPDPELPWTRVVEAAREVRDRLTELGLESFVKTTGGKGLHVVVPLERRHSWDEVRDFSHALAEELVRRSSPPASAIPRPSGRGRRRRSWRRGGRGGEASPCRIPGRRLRRGERPHPSRCSPTARADW